MKKTQLVLLSATAMVLTSCSGKLGALSADYFTVTPNPLETQQGQVPATISGVFPEKYMKKKAVVTVTPELRFNGQSVKGQSATFQGEKVLGNDQSISYKAGGRYDMKSTWKYPSRHSCVAMPSAENARVTFDSVFDFIVPVKLVMPS